MVVEQSFSYSQAGAGNMSASRIYSKLLEESDADRKAEAAKVKSWLPFPPSLSLARDALSRALRPTTFVSPFRPPHRRADQVGRRRRRRADRGGGVRRRAGTPQPTEGHPRHHPAPSREDRLLLHRPTGHVSTILLKVFKKFDEDNNGTVDWYEFDRAMIHLGVRVSEQGSRTMILDTDGTGEIRWREFLDWVDDRKPMTMAKMRRIIAAHEGSAHAAKKKHAADVPPSHAYMKAWLDVHGEATDAHVAEIAARGSRGSDGAHPHRRRQTDGWRVEDRRGDGDAQEIARGGDRRAPSGGAETLGRRAASTPTRRSSGVGSTRRARASSTGASHPRHALLGLDYSTDELTQIMKEFDANCDGHIDWVEFVGHLMPRESDDRRRGVCGSGSMARRRCCARRASHAPGRDAGGAGVAPALGVIRIRTVGWGVRSR